MGETLNVPLMKAQSAARRALFELFAEWQTQVTADGPVRYIGLADKMDTLIETLADFIETRTQVRAGAKTQVQLQVERPFDAAVVLDDMIRKHQCREHGMVMPHFGCAETVRWLRERGMSVEPYTVPTIEHPFVQYVGKMFASKHPDGTCGVVTDDGMTCGWPRGAHR